MNKFTPATQAAFTFNFSKTQRWRDRRERRLPANGTIDPREFGVEPISQAEARAFIETHHYSGRMTARRFIGGLFRKTGVAPACLVGVCVIGPGSNNNTIQKWTGLPYENGAELSRLVLLDEVAGNGESWFVSKVFSLLRQAKPEISGVVSFADPVERILPDGITIKPGHFGSIYAALSAVYGGTSTPRPLWFDRKGRIVSPRSIEKVKILDPRGDSAVRQLIETGAPPRDHGEHPAAWLKRVLPLVCTRYRHPGNHTFIWGLTASARAKVTRTIGSRQPYPKPNIIGRPPPVLIQA